MTFRFLNPPTMPRANGYSHVAEVTGGKIIYLSGQIALDSSGNLVGAGDMRAQAQQVFANLQAGLAAVGADFRSVVKFTVFIIDISQMQAVRDVRDQFVDKQNPPASSAVQVSALVRPDLLVEIEAVAVIPA